MDDGESGDEAGEAVLTLDELVHEDEQMELEEMTMRGQASEDECTYEKGYMKRQGIFACKTCQENGCLPAALCYGCSYSCHAGHEIYELWSKRNYRCDCGNSRFLGRKCELCPDKDSVNVKNNYDSQNLRGLYCSCGQPYSGDCSMVLCCICEDWFHPGHIGVILSDADDSCVICPICSHKFASTLMPYYPLYHATTEGRENEIRRPSTAALSLLPGECLLPKLAVAVAEQDLMHADEEPMEQMLRGAFNGVNATVWKQEWRENLCRCPQCSYGLESEGLSFLTDREDTIEHYLQNAKKTDEEIKSVLGGLERTAQVEVLTIMQEFREQLLEFLRSCSESGKVVTQEDVLEFFRTLRTKRSTSSDNCPDPQ